MRILIALSGILLALGGAFCFVFNTNVFSDLAFVMGLVMIISGVLCVIAYIASGKGRRLPDTLLVENIVSMLFGFAVLNNQVPDNMTAVFFGSWLAVAGASRLAQGLSISRFNSRDWIRVLPLGAVCALLGAIMMMPTLVSTMNAMVLVGAAFMLDGLSQMILSMYIYAKPAEKALAAKERADAKKAASRAKRDQRRMMRDLTEQEREDMLAREREAKKKDKLERQKAIQEEKLARKNARRDPKEITVQLSDQEVAEIARLADAAAAPEEAVKLDSEAENEAAETADDRPSATPEIVWNTEEAERRQPEPQKTAVNSEWNPDFDAIFANREKLLKESGETEKNIEKEAEAIQDLADEVLGKGPESAGDAEDEKKESEPPAPEEVKLWPEFKRPEAIPSLRESLIQESSDEPVQTEKPRIAAINIAEIESGEPEVVFDPVELPEVVLASEEQEAVDRDKLLNELGSEIEKEEPESNYTPISLEELVNEPMPNRHSEEKDRERFTTTFSFSWEELEKKLAEVEAEKKKTAEKAEESKKSGKKTSSDDNSKWS